MLYFLFLTLNIVLFLRPAELVPGMRGLPLYQITILISLVTAMPVLLKLTELRSIRVNPVTGCVLLLLLAVSLSHFARFTSVSIYYGRTAFQDFGKIVLYYLLAFAALNNERQFEGFLRWLMFMITLIAALSLGHDRGWITIPELSSVERSEMLESGESIHLNQLRGTGIFNDPNDLAMILTIGIVVAIHVVLSAQAGFAKMVALPALGICLLGLFETKSRGGVLAFMSALCVLSYTRWGIWRAIALGAIGAGLVATIFRIRGGGSTETGTAQHRIQIWAEGLAALRESPLFGIGYKRFVEEMGFVAHNSFVHSFTELGLFGGSFFLGAFLVSSLAIWRLWNLDEIDLPPENRRRLVTIFSCLSGASVAMLSLSRCYVVPTYLILAMGAAVVAIETRRLDEEEVEIDLPHFDAVFLKKTGASSVCFLGITYIFVRIAVHWG